MARFGTERNRAEDCLKVLWHYALSIKVNCNWHFNPYNFQGYHFQMQIEPFESKKKQKHNQRKKETERVLQTLKLNAQAIWQFKKLQIEPVPLRSENLYLPRIEFS